MYVYVIMDIYYTIFRYFCDWRTIIIIRLVSEAVE